MSEVLCACGQMIRPINWAMGPGWTHQNGQSTCLTFARPFDKDEGDRVLADFAERIGVPLR